MIILDYTDEELDAARNVARRFVEKLEPSHPNYLNAAVNGALLGLRICREDKINGTTSYIVTEAPPAAAVEPERAG